MTDNIEKIEEVKAEDLNRYIEFSLGVEVYTIRLLMIREVIPVPETTPLPNGKNYFVGIMNLRGQIISIIDLRKKLNITPKKSNEEEAVIIVNIQGISVGLIVDSINSVFDASKDDINEFPEVNSQVKSKYIQGIFQRKEYLAILIDIESILDINDIKALKSRAA